MNSPKTKYTLVKMTNGTNKLVLKAKKTLSQDLYNGIFHPKTSSNIRDLIFKFKCEARFEIVDTTIRHFDKCTWSPGSGKINFKDYCSGKKGSQYPIKNRKELYVIYRDWIRCHHYLSTGPFIRREEFEGTLEEFVRFRGTQTDWTYDIEHLVRDTLEKLVDIDRFQYGVEWPELWRILLTNDKFDKKLILKTNPRGRNGDMFYTKTW